MAIGDLNEDGFPDIVTANDTSENSLSILMGNGDGRGDLVAGRGPDPTADTEVKVFTYDGAAVSQWLSLEAFSGLTHGTNVAEG